MIVNHYRAPKVLKLALGYVEVWQKNTIGQGKKVEVIVTDSETIPETVEMMREHFPRFIFLKERKNIGFGHSVNRALERAHGKYIFIMNADIVIPHPKELNSLIGYLEQNEDVGIAGPRLLNFDETHQPSAFRYYKPITIAMRRTPLGKTPWGKRHIAAFTLKHCAQLTNAPTPVDWLMGSALLARKQDLNKIGFFDDRYFMYMEDVDLCRRFWEEGLKVMYYPLSTMYHFHGAASRNKSISAALLNKYTRIHLASAYKYFRKYGLKTPRYGV